MKNPAYSLDISLFRKVREYSDGISFLDGGIEWDRYEGDHKPSFKIWLLVCNIMVFEFEVYNINHVK